MAESAADRGNLLLRGGFAISKDVPKTLASTSPSRDPSGNHARIVQSMPIAANA